jgi:curli biogenesis system outer membrane secretion channel CsgG
LNRKLLVLFLAVYLLVGCATAPPPTDTETKEDLQLNLPPFSGQPKIIAVLDLRNQSEFKDEPRIGRGISQMLITALVNSGRFTVVERNEQVLNSILKEQSLGLSGVIDPMTAAKVGKLLGAQAVVIGEISEFGIRKTGAFVGLGGTKTITTRVVFDARMVDVENGKIIAGETGVGESSTHTSGVALTFEFGTAGFDETTIGISTRKSVNQVVKKFAQAVDNNKLER